MVSYLQPAQRLGSSPRMASGRLQPGQTLLLQHHQQHRALPFFQPRCPHHRAFQPTASQRFFDIRIQSSWGGGNSSSQSTDAVGSRWWSAGNQDSEQEPEQQQQQSSSTDRWGSIFNNNRDGTSSSYSSHNGNGGSSYSNGNSYAASYGSKADSSDDSSSSSIATGPVAGSAAPWVMAALIPTMLWCITWLLTGGMVTLANTSMTGMCSLARLLFPSLPVRGVDYEDIAVSLVKALHTGTDIPSTWTRPGLFAPSWLLRGIMSAMFNLAIASSSVASVLIPNQQVLLVSGISQGLMYFTCLLLMLPLGVGISSLAQQLLQLAKQHQITLPSLPSAKLPFSLPRLSDNTALALKLAGMLAWPCISASAVLQPSALAQNAFATNFAVAASQVAVCALLLVLLLAAAVTAGRFAVLLGRQQAGTEAVKAFGLQIGVVCAAAGLLNVVQIGLGLASGLLGPSQLAVPVVSCLILARVVWSIRRLYCIGSGSTASMWLQLLSFTPELKGTQAAPTSS